jgi:hypothetical protein
MMSNLISFRIDSFCIFEKKPMIMSPKFSFWVNILMIKVRKWTEKPFLLFFPFLVIYVIVVFTYKTDVDPATGDQMGYMNYAKELLNSLFTLTLPDVYLVWGPGYPLLLAILFALKLPLISIKLLNAVLLYVSVVLLFVSLRKFVSLKLSLFFSLFWAVYLNIYELIPFELPEIFAAFLVTLILWSISKAFSLDPTVFKKRYLFFSGFFIGYLALTKVIFGYVLMTFFPILVLLFFVDRKNIFLKKSIIIFLVAFATVSPWLVYTFHSTGRVFYWSEAGGNNLYWMSTPYDEEYGSWYYFESFNNDSLFHNHNNFKIAEHTNKHANHINVYLEISHLEGVERDDALKKAAIQNIKANPKKFFLNCISNLGRILFNFPYSYKLQTPRTLIRLPFNGFIVVFALLSLIPTLYCWRKVPFFLRFLLLFSLIYLGGSVFGSAETRMFSVIVPIFLFWICFTISKSVIIKINYD